MKRYRMIPDMSGNFDSATQVFGSFGSHQLEFEGLPHFFHGSYTVSVGQEYRHKNTSVFLINFHFVWCPKRRRKVLVGPVEKDLRKLIQEQAALLESEIVALEIRPDHVHLFLNAHPSVAPDEIMFHIKGSSSRTLRKKYSHLARMTSLWTRSYFCSTAGNVSSATIQRYIENQKTR